MLINGREKVENKILTNPEAIIDYSQTTDDVYENLEDYNPTNKRRVLIVFDSRYRIKPYSHWIVFKVGFSKISVIYFFESLLKMMKNAF